MKTAARRQVFNEINITPLTDIFLVLLIIMMVVAPMVQQLRRDIKPPALAHGQPVEQQKLVVEITRKGSVYVAGVETMPDKLSDTLKEQEGALLAKAGVDEKKQAETEKNLVIRADKTTKSGDVLKVFAAAQEAGFAKVTISGESLSEARQSTLENSTRAGSEEESTQ